MTRNLSAHPALLLNPAFSKCCLSFYMVTILHNSKILLSLLLLSHSTISNFYQFINQNYLGLVIPFFFFFEIETLVQLQLLLLALLLCQCHTMLFALDICVNERFLQLIACFGVSTSLKNITSSFLSNASKICKLSKPPFKAIHPQYIGFLCTLVKSKFLSELPY